MTASFFPRETTLGDQAKVPLLCFLEIFYFLFTFVDLRSSMSIFSLEKLNSQGS